ncbi:amidohydrolase family protein [Pontibacter sp. E15-1]|uniref:amidohydrolase family protein n=1 Tax=Pontibacter sp. E15-1 TaxID=2919918 RepID=UPI001F4F4D10|nr:amidohydrolase family protein [Pontibacter sp. E15-1]MCJ8165909.1 amidohydrolase family protein [Pontibacter sp. E15-1]
MKSIYLLTVTILILFCACSKRVGYDLAITNAKLFDSENKQIFNNKTILINSDTIAAIVNSDQKILAKERIEGNGRLVSPGFIDTHIHLTDIIGDYDTAPVYIPKDSIAIYRDRLAKTHLNYGITTVADMGQSEKWMNVSLDWQKNPEPNAPNLFIGGGALISDEERKPYLNHVEVLNPEEAQKKVQEYYDMGLRHIKLYWRLREPEMKAAVEKAKSLNMNMFAHIDNNVMSIDETLDMGVKNFEHASTISNDVFLFEEHGDSLNKIMQQHYPDIRAYMPYALEKIQYVEDSPELRDRREKLIQKMIDMDATLSTTIHLFGSFSGRTYFNSFLESYYSEENPELNENQIKRMNTAFDSYMAYIKEAHDKGLKLRIGTDSKDGGKAALSEMLLLYEAGISIEDTLQIATYNGAKAMNIDDDFGSIKPGKKADLIVFDKDPFDDYKNLLSDKIIIKGGDLYKKK